jgi:hypothetical protein
MDSSLARAESLGCARFLADTPAIRIAVFTDPDAMASELFNRQPQRQHPEHPGAGGSPG